MRRHVSAIGPRQSIPGIARRRGIVAGLVGLAVMVQFGCAGRPSALGTPGGTQAGLFAAESIVADWDDLDAALEIALTACELGVLARQPVFTDIERTDEFSSTPYPDRVETGRVWRLVTRDGRRGELRVTRYADQAVGGDRANAIDLAVRIGPFGTPSEERCLIDAMVGRLEQLQGAGAKPL